MHLDKEESIVKFMKATALLFFALLLAGCNTMEGMGEDTQEAGEAVEEEASEY